MGQLLPLLQASVKCFNIWRDGACAEFTDMYAQGSTLICKTTADLAYQLVQGVAATVGAYDDYDVRQGAYFSHGLGIPGKVITMVTPYITDSCKALNDSTSYAQCQSAALNTTAALTVCERPEFYITTVATAAPTSIPTSGSAASASPSQLEFLNLVVPLLVTAHVFFQFQYGGRRLRQETDKSSAPRPVLR
jgi:hypothetical protein